MANARKHRRELSDEIGKLRCLQQIVDPSLDEASAKALAVRIRDQAEICLDLLDRYQSSVPGRMWSYTERTCQPLRQDLKRTAMQSRVATGEWEIRFDERLWGQSSWSPTQPASSPDPVDGPDLAIDSAPVSAGPERPSEPAAPASPDVAVELPAREAGPIRQDDEQAALLGLRGLLGLHPDHDLGGTMEGLAALHRPDGIFPAEVLLELAAVAIEESGASLHEPIQYEGLRDRHLPECDFQGRASRRKSRYALMAAAMMRAGVYPDLLEEASWWGTEDMWEYAFYALVVYARAAAERTNRPLEEVATAMASRRGLDAGCLDSDGLLLV